MSGVSTDIRKVTCDGKTMQVDYVGKSKQENGLHSYDLRMRFACQQDGVLTWDLTLKNTTGLTLELGEVAFPFLLNDEYGAYGTQSSNVLTTTEAKQRNIHEQKVLSFHYIGGHSFLHPAGAPHGHRAVSVDSAAGRYLLRMHVPRRRRRRTRRRTRSAGQSTPMPPARSIAGASRGSTTIRRWSSNQAKSAVTA